MENKFYIDHLKNNFKSYLCISKKYDYIFYTIYKNASTKIKAELKDDTYILNKSQKNYHDKEKYSLIEKENNSILKNLNKYDIKNIYKVSIVRNPINRYISLFNYFKGSKRGRLMKIYNDTDINDWTINYFDFNYDKLDFVSNYHFNTQSSFIIYNKILVCDEIIKLENINYNELKSKNINLSEKFFNKSNKNNNLKLNEKSISIIKRIYFDDFNNFYKDLL